MNQRMVTVWAKYGKEGYRPIAESDGDFETRRDMAAWIDHCLAKWNFSARSRRQVDMVRLWQFMQSGKSGHFRIRDTIRPSMVATFEFE